MFSAMQKEEKKYRLKDWKLDQIQSFLFEKAKKKKALQWNSKHFFAIGKK